jgi:hypothetical protein
MNTQKAFKAMTDKELRDIIVAGYNRKTQHSNTASALNEMHHRSLIPRTDIGVRHGLK